MKREVPWPHAPTHRLAASGTYFVTAGTYEKQHFFSTRQRLDVLHRGLLTVAAEYAWRFEAWAVFPNHYHFVAHSPDTGAESLPMMLGKLHTKTAAWLSRQDCAPGRKVWHNYWETILTLESSYLSRLSYVHQNAVHHRVVRVANQYPWCSAGWFEVAANPAQVRTIYGMKTDRVRVPDDYGVFPVEV